MDTKEGVKGDVLCSLCAGKTEVDGQTKLELSLFDLYTSAK